MDDGGFSDRVAFGMLTASFLSTMAGVYLPGKLRLIHSVKVKFIKPVIIGDCLKVKGSVIEKNDTFKLLTLKVTIENQDKIRVGKAMMKVGVINGK